MNIPNAFLFVGVGLAMELLHFSPEITGVRELWLMVMGIVCMLTGAVFLTQAAWLWAKPRVVVPALALLPKRAESTGRRAVPNGHRAPI